MITSTWLCLYPSDTFILLNIIVNLNKKVYILSISPLSYPSWKIFLLLSFPSMYWINALLGFVPRWVVSCLKVSFQFIPRLNLVSDSFNDWVSLGIKTWIESSFILHLWILCPLGKNLIIVPHWRRILFLRKCFYHTPLKFITNNKWLSLYLRSLFCS